MSGVSEPLLFAIRAATGITLVPATVQGVTGGSISSCYRVRDRQDRAWFLKVNAADCAGMFAAEAEGLRELRAALAVRAPEPVGQGTAEDAAWLLLEWLDLEPGSADAATRLGERLALQHRHVAERFGWQCDNTIGSTPQPNTPDADWVRFWCERRLGFQLALAARQGHADVAGRGERLLVALPGLLEGHAPAASLLHGDLWGGNWAMARNGEPVVFDPAVYYGDREADIAMTELFGGFPRTFYVAYERVWPLDPGYGRRRDVYNLYHVLNHLNLFGGGYCAQALALMDRLLAPAPARRRRSP
ncbi:MAG: fructosamine kinase family protein [Gammaproteobacteria bacterium]|nr:fructosamine kinase family protein [Gammaproteobacteria bacterium]